MQKNTQEPEEEQMPAKDTFEDGSDSQLLIGDNNPEAANEEAAARAPAKKQIDRSKIVEWRYVWVESPNITIGLPPIYTRKWVRNVRIVQSENGAEPETDKTCAPCSKIFLNKQQLHVHNRTKHS